MSECEAVLEISGQEAKQLFKFALAAASARDAKNIFVKAIRAQPSEALDDAWLPIPLVDAAVITYARPFTSNNLIGALARPRGLDDAERDLHQQLLDQRREAVAHSDATGIQMHLLIHPAGGWHAEIRGVDGSSKSNQRTLYNDVDALNRAASLSARLETIWKAKLDQQLARHFTERASMRLHLTPPIAGSTLFRAEIRPI